jgi:hypothetical protein
MWVEESSEVDEMNKGHGGKQTKERERQRHVGLDIHLG